MINYSTPVKNAMLCALADLIDAADPAPGRLLLYTANQPVAGAAISDQIMVAECLLALPCGTVSNGQLNLTAPLEDNNLPASGEITWGRLLNGAGEWIADLDAETETEPPSSTAALRLSKTSVYKGGIIRLNDGVLTLV